MGSTRMCLQHFPSIYAIAKLNLSSSVSIILDFQFISRLQNQFPPKQNISNSRCFETNVQRIGQYEMEIISYCFSVSFTHVLIHYTSRAI